MRIPLITRIRFKYAFIFAVFLFATQALERTDLGFAALTSVLILLSTIAFNAAGGFPYPSAWYIFFNPLLTAILGLTAKAMLGQPGETHLLAPRLTMLTYCVGMALTIPVAVLTRKLRPKQGLLAGMGTGEEMKKAAIGSFLLGAFLQVAGYAQQENGSFLSALRQINYFIEMSLMLGVFYQVGKSHGTKTTNWIVWAAGILMFVANGLLGFSKQGLLVSMVTWLITAVVAGHTFTRKQLLLVIAGFAFFQFFLVPYSQVGRVFRVENGTLADDAAVALGTLPRLSEIRRQYVQNEKDISEDLTKPHLFDESEGFLDRLSLISEDDALTAYTAEGNEEGLLPTWYAILNVIPHFIWKDKPFYYTGNGYAKEIGMIDEENDSTGISFSPVADAFHQASFFGIILILPPTLFLLFMVMDSLSGDIRQAPWGILFCVTLTHTAPEGLIAGQIYVATYVAFGVVVIALLSRYVLPIVSGVLTNSERTRVRRTTDFKPVLHPRSQPIDLKPRPAQENL